MKALALAFAALTASAAVSIAQVQLSDDPAPGSERFDSNPGNGRPTYNDTPFEQVMPPGRRPPQRPELRGDDDVRTQYLDRPDRPGPRGR